MATKSSTPGGNSSTGRSDCDPSVEGGNSEQEDTAPMGLSYSESEDLAMPLFTGPVSRPQPARVGIKGKSKSPSPKLRKLLSDQGYEVESFLGRGGMGSVYKAKGQGGLCAIKIFHLVARNNKGFLTELSNLNRVCGLPGVVRYITTLDLSHGVYAIVMEYVQGTRLRKILESKKESKDWSGRDVLHMVCRISKVIAVLHSGKDGLLHNDLKPENILIRRSADGRFEDICIVDFGSACGIEKSGFTVRAPDRTPRYTAPELREGGRSTAAGEVWALGRVFEDVLGRFSEQLDPACRERVQELVKGMLDPDPSRRPSLNQVASALHSSEQEHSGPIVLVRQAEPASRDGISWRARLQHTVLPLVAIAVGAVALLYAGWWGLGRWPSPSQPDVQQATPPPPGMVLVRAGAFRMGSSAAAVEGALRQCRVEACQGLETCPAATQQCRRETFAREMPEQQVAFDRDYYVDERLVSNAEWAQYLNNLGPHRKVEPGDEPNEYRFVIEDQPLCDLDKKRSHIRYDGSQFSVNPGHEAEPVEQVTWIGANLYCRYAGKILLSEAVWEFVKKIDPLKFKNELGGEKLGEWVSDKNRQYYIPLKETRIDPSEGNHHIDPEDYHIVRGCAQGELPVFCRPSARGLQQAKNGPVYVGFRCMLAASAKLQ